MLNPRQMFFFSGEEKCLHFFFRPIGATVDLEKMLKNAPTLAIIAVHTAENEPLKVLGVIQFNIQSTP